VGRGVATVDDFVVVGAPVALTLACVVDAGAVDVVATAAEVTRDDTAAGELEPAATCPDAPLEQAPIEASTGMVNSMPAARIQR
jgi:hypothetical protein